MAIYFAMWAIFLEGGNWIATDQFQRFAGSDLYFIDEFFLKIDEFFLKLMDFALKVAVF